jgi:hypothetical protein
MFAWVSHLFDNDRSRTSLPDKKLAPNHTSSSGMSIGMHAAMITQFASTLMMC